MLLLSGCVEEKDVSQTETAVETAHEAPTQTIKADPTQTIKADESEEPEAQSSESQEEAGTEEQYGSNEQTQDELDELEGLLGEISGGDFGDIDYSE